MRALTKVVQVMPPRLRRRVEALRAVTVPATWDGTAPPLDPAVLTTLAQACRDDERLEFGYTAARGERTDRHVEPHRLVPLGRRWYLVAYDLGRHDWRSFRLDRITEPRRTGARFLPRKLPAEDAAAFVRAGIRSIPATYRVEVLVHAPAERLRPQLGRWAEIDRGGRADLRAAHDDRRARVARHGARRRPARSSRCASPPSWWSCCGTGPPASPVPGAPEATQATPTVVVSPMPGRPGRLTASTVSSPTSVVTTSRVTAPRNVLVSTVPGCPSRVADAQRLGPAILSVPARRRLADRRGTRRPSGDAATVVHHPDELGDERGGGAGVHLLRRRRPAPAGPR